MNNLKVSTNRVNESMLSDDPSTSISAKKRRLDDDNEYQDEIDSMKDEMEEMKKLIDKQKDMIYTQTMTIGDLQKEHDRLTKSAGGNKNIGHERFKTVEAELRSKIVQLEAQMKDDKKKFEAELAEQKSVTDNQVINFEKQREAAEKKIKQLEEELTSTKDVNPGFSTGNEDERKALQEKINELQAACNEYAKKIKEMEAQTQLNESTETYLHKTIDEMEELHSGQTKLLQVENDRLKAVLVERDKKINGLEAAIEGEKKNVSKLQFELQEIQKRYKDDLNKNKNLKDEYNDKMVEMQEKLDKDRKKYEAEINGLNVSNIGLNKIITKDQKTLAHCQNQIDKLKNEITVAKTKETALQSKNEELKQKELEACAAITNSETQIEDLQTQLEQTRSEPTVRFVELNEICDGSSIAYDRLLNPNNTTVLKVQNIKRGYPFSNEMEICVDTSSEKPFKLNFAEYVKNVLQFQINGEFEMDYHTKQIMPLVHSCNLKKLELTITELKYEDFMKLVSSHTITTFITHNCAVKRENGEVLEIDEILKELPNIENFVANEISDMSCQKLVQLPTLTNLRKFEVNSIKRAFDLSYSADLITKYQNVEFIFEFPSCRNKEPYNKIAKGEKELRKKLPSNCNVIVKYCLKQ